MNERKAARLAAHETLKERVGILKSRGIQYKFMWEKLKVAIPDLKLYDFNFALSGQSMTQCPAILEALEEVFRTELAVFAKETV